MTSACDAFMVGSFKWQSVPWVWKWQEKLKSTTLYYIQTLHYTSTAGSSWLSLQRTANQSCRYSESRHTHFWRRLTPASLMILNLSLLGADCVWRAAVRFSRLFKDLTPFSGFRFVSAYIFLQIKLKFLVTLYSPLALVTHTDQGVCFTSVQILKSYLCL